MVPCSSASSLEGRPRRTGERNKKTDVAEHPQVFRHVGLLFNETPGAAGLLFI